MRFYNQPHRHYCGIDLHVKTMYVCILDASGQVLVHRNVAATPAAFLEIVAPYREDLVVSAECMFTWYWLADVCAAEGIRFVLGHALAMKAIHGSKSKNDKIDSHKIAHLLRGGLLPQSYVYPAAMRSTRDLLRRRLHLVRKRGQLLAHIQHTRAQYQVPEFARRLAYPPIVTESPSGSWMRVSGRASKSTSPCSNATTASSPIWNTPWCGPRNNGRAQATSLVMRRPT